MQVGIPVNQVITLPQGFQLLKLPGSSCDIYAIWLGHLIVDGWTWPNFDDRLDAITVFLDPDTLCIKFTTQIKLPPLCFWYWRNVCSYIYRHVYIIIHLNIYIYIYLYVDIYILLYAYVSRIIMHLVEVYTVTSTSKGFLGKSNQHRGILKRVLWYEGENPLKQRCVNTS